MTIAYEISYAAHTASCTFLLDEEGICRRIVMAPKAKRRESARTSSKCVGAQYVASLDSRAAGLMVEMPRVGASMLFARVDENGRVSLVRTGAVLRFESHRREPPVEDPFVEPMSSRSVETSAPVLEALEPRTPPKTERFVPPPRQDTIDTPRKVAINEILESRDPDYQDMSDRTQRIPALRPQDIANMRLGDDDQTNELGSEMATAQWRAADHALPPRTQRLQVNESGPVSRQPPAPPPSRGVLPKRSDPKLRAAAAARAYLNEPARTPQAQDSDVVIRRRRG